MMKKTVLCLILVTLMVMCPLAALAKAQTTSPTPTPTPTPSESPSPTPSPSPTTTTESGGNVTITDFNIKYNYNLYAPARVIVEYKYTSDFSGPVNVQTLRGNLTAETPTLWSATVSPTSIMFEAEDPDSYEFDVILRYNFTVGQFISIGTWSGTEAPNSADYWVKSSVIALHFEITLSVQPKIPEAPELAEGIVEILKQDLDDTIGSLQVMTSELQANVVVMWAVIAVTFFVAILTLIVCLIVLKQQKGAHV